ncbi:MAG: DNA damage-inducible protein D [Candidatus Woesearchaeota archaeon]|jgi:DNA-damage-inducible protein D
MSNNIFEQIKHVNEYGQEYWSGRELSKVLEYSEYRFFVHVIEKAKISCKNSKQKITDHFDDVLDMVEIGSGATRSLQNYKLSRYACYLIIQNADPTKEIVALGQTYFAIQTRKQEINEQFMEDKKRVLLRDELTNRNKVLAKTAKASGVTKFGVFQDYGYMGLYGGLRQKDIHVKKKLKSNEKILDHMGAEELAANLFRSTQAEAKLRRENIVGEQKANKTHFEIGKKVRSTIKELGGEMPENLPKVEHIKNVKKRNKTLCSKADDLVSEGEGCELG